MQTISNSIKPFRQLARAVPLTSKCIANPSLSMEHRRLRAVHPCLFKHWIYVCHWYNLSLTNTHFIQIKKNIKFVRKFYCLLFNSFVWNFFLKQTLIHPNSGFVVLVPQDFGRCWTEPPRPGTRRHYSSRHTWPRIYRRSSRRRSSPPLKVRSPESPLINYPTRRFPGRFQRY